MDAAPPSLEAEKAALRRRMRALLRAVAPEARRERSLAAARRLAGLPEAASAVNVLSFRSLATEPDTALVVAALGSGRRVFFPRLEGGSLVFVRVGAATTWRPGERGIEEPASGEVFGAGDLVSGPTIVLVPGLAFGERGERLGRGGGHYDRALASAPFCGRAVAVGLGCDLQVLASVPTAEHDVPMTFVVTESRVIVAR